MYSFKNKIFAIFFFTITFWSGFLFAENTDCPLKETSRKGFFVGTDIGGGGLHLSNNRNSGAFIGSFKVGAGLSERVLLLYEDTLVLGTKSDNRTIYSSYFAT